MYESSSNLGTNNSEGAGAAGAGTRAGSTAEQAREQLRSAKAAVSDTMSQARTWGQGQVSQLQQRVQEDPYRAAAWALGIGFVAGILMGALARGRS